MTLSLGLFAHGESYGACNTPAAALDAPTAEQKGHWLTIGRGCAFNCIYCGGSKEAHTELAARSGYVMRDPVNVVDDVEQLAASGYKQVSLSLDPATFPARWWRTFFGELQARGIRIGIYNEFFQLPSGIHSGLGGSGDLEHTEVAISPRRATRKSQPEGKHYSNELFCNAGQPEAPNTDFVYFSLTCPAKPC